MAIAPSVILTANADIIKYIVNDIIENDCLNLYNELPAIKWDNLILKQNNCLHPSTKMEQMLFCNVAILLANIANCLFIKITILFFITKCCFNDLLCSVCLKFFNDVVTFPAIKWDNLILKRNNCLHPSTKMEQMLFCNVAILLANIADNLLILLKNLNLTLIFANRLTILPMNKWLIPPPQHTL